MTSTAKNLDELMTSKRNLKPQQTAWKEQTSVINSFLRLEVTCYACLLTHVFLVCEPMDSIPPGSFCPWNFSRQEYWSGLPFPSPEDLPDPGIEPTSPEPPALAGGFLPLGNLGSHLSTAGGTKSTHPGKFCLNKHNE